MGKLPSPDSRFRSPSAEQFRDVYDAEVWSSALVGTGANGVVKLFVTPVGQGVIRAGDVPADLFPSHIPFTTNMWKAAQLYSIGDMAIRGVRADFIGGDVSSIQALLEATEFELKVAGKVEREFLLRDLPQLFDTPVLVGMLDTLEASLSFRAPLPRIAPTLVRIVLSGQAARDIR